MNIQSLSSSVSSSFDAAGDGKVSGQVSGQSARLQAAAEQFEALFLQQVLRQMRKAGDVLAADNPMHSRELDTLRDFYDDNLAQSLASKKQTGIADMLVKQLSGGQSSDSKSAGIQSLEQASQLARAADLPARASMAASRHLGELQQGWERGLERGLQRGLDSLANVWHKGSAGFKALVDSVIRQESGGRVDAVSERGALGVMQLMPDTARDIADELGLGFSRSRLTRDADYNKQLGSAFLHKMLNRYDGNQALAVAAYNAGPARVDEWLARNGDPRRGEVSTASWIKQIPFKETRDYTGKVLADLLQHPVESAVSAALNPASTTNLENTSAASVIPLIPGQERFKLAPVSVALTEKSVTSAIEPTRESTNTSTSTRQGQGE